MKTQIGLYIGVGTAEELKAKALTSGASIGDLADLCIRVSLAKLSDAQIRAWAVSLPNLRGRTGGGIRKSEAAALAALQALEKQHAPSWRFDTHDVAVAGNLKTAEAFSALTALQARGLVHALVMDDEPDRFGRPKKCVWNRVSRGG